MVRTQTAANPHLRRQHLRWGTGWDPAALGSPGTECRVSVCPTSNGSNRWLSRWWAAAGIPGWDWWATPGCRGCGEGPRSGAPAWQRPPPPHSKIPFRTWPGRGVGDAPVSVWGAPRLQTQRCRYSPLCSRCILWMSIGAESCSSACRAPASDRVEASRTGRQMTESWLTEGREKGDRKKGRRGRFRKKKNLQHNRVCVRPSQSTLTVHQQQQKKRKEKVFPRLGAGRCSAWVNPPFYCIAERDPWRLSLNVKFCVKFSCSELSRAVVMLGMKRMNRGERWRWVYLRHPHKPHCSPQSPQYSSKCQGAAQAESHGLVRRMWTIVVKGSSSPMIDSVWSSDQPLVFVVTCWCSITEKDPTLTYVDVVQCAYIQNTLTSQCCSVLLGAPSAPFAVRPCTFHCSGERHMQIDANL